jgi:hypothetical protein
LFLRLEKASTDKKEGNGKKRKRVDDDDEDDEDDLTGSAWNTGDVGGFECYIEVEDDENAEAAEVFKIDQNTQTTSQLKYRKPNEMIGEEEPSLLSVSAGFNVLNLVMRDDRVMRYVRS